jgi:hypothetical protein
MVQFATLTRVVTPRIAKFHYPRRNFLSGFFCFDQNSSVVSLATMSCSLVLSFLQFLLAFFRFVLLLDWVFIPFLKLFFLLPVGSRIFLSLSEVAVFSVVLSLVLCRQLGHHLLEHLVLWMVLEHVLSSQLLLSGEPQVLPFVLDLCCVKVLEWEWFRCLRHGGALLGRTQWEHSSWTTSVVASWAVFRLKPRWAPMLGVRKSEGVPEHKSHERRGDKESPKACTRLKSCESLYTCPRAPFYRETKGLLHSEITLKSREYS